MTMTMIGRMMKPNTTPPDVRDSYRNHDNSDVEDELAELTNRNQITRRHKKRRNRFNEKYVDGIPRNLDWRKYGKSRH